MRPLLPLNVGQVVRVGDVSSLLGRSTVQLKPTRKHLPAHARWHRKCAANSLCGAHPSGECFKLSGYFLPPIHSNLSLGRRI
jgi:hypothetical protein